MVLLLIGDDHLEKKFDRRIFGLLGDFFIPLPNCNG